MEVRTWSFYKVQFDIQEIMNTLLSIQWCNKWGVWQLHILIYHKCVRLTHCGPSTLIRVSKLTIGGSDNGLSPGRRQAIIWIKARILLIVSLGTNFTEWNLNKNPYIILHEMYLKLEMAAILPRPQCVKPLYLFFKNIACLVIWQRQIFVLLQTKVHDEVINNKTHRPLDKMAAILADEIFNCIFLNENDRIAIQISLKYVARNTIDKKQHWFK